MRRTVVCCSTPGCPEPAVARVAASWSYGRFRELTTYGYACESHVAEVVDRAQGRPKPILNEGEERGAIGSYRFTQS